MTIRNTIRISAAVIILFLLTQRTTHAQILLPKVFGNDMVLQRDIPIPIWGKASPLSRITAEMGAVRASARADKDGNWIVRLPKLKAGGPYTLKIVENGKPDAGVEFKGILIGDVWLASGQSNMELQVQQSMNAPEEITNADNLMIRFLFVEHDKKLTPQTDIQRSAWKICDTTNVKQFSAVAYYFARTIHREQHVPIGIIQSTWGGTPVESWTSREKLLSSPLTKISVQGNDTLTPGHFLRDSLDLVRFWEIVLSPQHGVDTTLPMADYHDSDWTQIEMPRVIKDFGIHPYEGIIWLRKKINLPETFHGKDLVVNLGHPEMNYSLYFNGVEICKTVWNASLTHHYTIPATLVKAGENTVSVRMAMLWGGGGFNPPAENIYLTDGTSKISLAGSWLYKKNLEPEIPKIRNYHYYPALLFNAMINPLIPYGIKGFLWYQGEANDSAAFKYRTLFPMLISDWRQRWHQGHLPFFYVQLPNFKKRQDQPSESEWAELREAQTMTLSQPNTGMACTIDLGDADNIHPTNKQEVGRRLALQAKSLVYKHTCIASGPMYKSYKIEGSRVRIHFANAGAGLSTNNGNAVAGFAVAGSDKHFHWAKASIEGPDVIVSADQVPAPVAVRYAWADNPECNLINAAGLPAVPFRTDDWKGLTQKKF